MPSMSGQSVRLSGMGGILSAGGIRKLYLFRNEISPFFAFRQCVSAEDFFSTFP